MNLPAWQGGLGRKFGIERECGECQGAFERKDYLTPGRQMRQGLLVKSLHYVLLLSFILLSLSRTQSMYTPLI